MLDTVILTLSKFRYQILVKTKFSPSAEHLEERSYFNTPFINNPRAEDKKLDRYLPRLTIRQRGHQGKMTADLRIEFSVPKLMFGNNLDELHDSQFPEMIKKLKNSLLFMGVLVSEENLARASVSAFHPSKNIVLTQGYTVSFVIQELNKVQLTKRLDLTRIAFRNEGKSLQYYANSYSIVFYDKLSDMNQPKGRAIDKDQTKRQLSIFEDLTAIRENLEIFRIEVRLSKKQKMNSLLRELGFKSDPKFCDVFNSKMCQAVLKHYWRTIVTSQSEYLHDATSKPISILKALQKRSTTQNCKQVIYLMGLAILCKEDGARELRGHIESTFSPRTWQRTKQDIDLMNNGLTSDGMKHQYFKDIEQSLEAMEPYQAKAKKTSTC